MVAGVRCLLVLVMAALAGAGCASTPAVRLNSGDGVRFDAKVTARSPSLIEPRRNRARDGVLGAAVNKTLQKLPNNVRSENHRARAAAVVDPNTLETVFHDALVEKSTTSFAITALAPDAKDCAYEVLAGVSEYGVRYVAGAGARAFVTSFYTMKACESGEVIFRRYGDYTVRLSKIAARVLPAERVHNGKSRSGTYKMLKDMSNEEIQRFYAALLTAAAHDGAMQFIGEVAPKRSPPS